MAGNAATQTAVADPTDSDDVYDPDYSQAGTVLADQSSILAEYQAHAPECILQSGYFSGGCIQAAVQSTDAGQMKASFVFVTRPKKNEPNRAGRMIQIVPGPNGDGINFANYQKNPVVLFNHGYDGFAFPLGLSEDKSGKFTVKASKQQASAEVYFNQSCPYAEDIFRMVDGKILRASSIGFNAQRAISMRWDDNPQLPTGVENCYRYGCDVVDSEMLEWSIVAVGADAGALRQCLETGKIGGKSYRPMLTPFLRQWAEPRQAWAPGFGGGVNSHVSQGVGVLADPATNGLKQMFSEFATTIAGSITQAIQGQGAAKSAASPPSLADTNFAQAAPVSTISQVSNAPAIPSVQPAAVQQEFLAALQTQLTAVVSRTVQSTIQPVMDAQNGINQRLDRLTGKLP